MTYFVYLDEFGHVGPYLSRSDSKHNSSPVFGFAGFLLPSSEVRGFGTWFYQRKCDLLGWEIRRDGCHPSRWEKKGSSLYTAKNVARYPELRRFTTRLFNKIIKIGGFIFYVGIKKTYPVSTQKSNRLYFGIFLEAIHRINQFCEPQEHNFALILDEHEQRSSLVTAASVKMYAKTPGRSRYLIEPPFHLESDRYQTVQAADWIAGLVGRWGAWLAVPASYPENEVFVKYFRDQIESASVRSSIRLH